MHSLDLSKGIDELYNCIHKTTKRNIKKANREGVQVTFSHSLESIKEYYHLHRLTRKRQGLPPQPYYFFNSIHNHIISKDKGFVALARIDGNCIAGAVYFHFGKHAIYKYGASKMSHQHLRPNNLLMWEAIKRYASDQFKSFDFGRTDLYHEGLRRFKRSWGTSERVLNYFKYNIGKEKFLMENSSKESTIQNIYKRMPMSLSKIVGNSLYKHMG
jgi:lipid II:glycine glycyltransferase (peptidoglycan interpeptide bridge formation enzyme)